MRELYGTAGFAILVLWLTASQLFADCKLQIVIEKSDEIWYNINNCEHGEFIESGGTKMSVNYDKLWGILKERNMMKTELIKKAKISTNAMAKLGRNEDVRVEILVKICKALDCKIDDIIEY